MQHRVIDGSRVRSGLIAVGGVFASAACGFVLTLPDPSLKVQLAGWVGVPFFALAALFGLVQTIRPVRLVLTARGFEYTGNLGAQRKVAWHDIEPLFVWQMGRSKIVAYKFLPGRRPDVLAYRVNQGFGMDGSLPTNLGMPKDALAALMNTYRSEALAEAAKMQIRAS